ncbi:MAG: LysM peptidoglycan-binding domain-containing protein [Clostridiales bacterium]|nr:LysM peptidoglycan-binding domain-containing protein [Clostridiales bacterium]MDO4349201.1 LysM peptidoglycan-binding domain-containing protein [Eubacteriales bacterium]MDY4007726.1 LysM peptidoglycan-binding domain-containing protein [Candidatus Limiplasma sp.]
MTQPENTGNCAEEYVVKRGDSFYLIAHKLGVPLRDLLAANRDIHPARLMVGDVLCIPREEDDSPSTGGLGGATGGNTGTTNGGATSGSTGTTNGSAGSSGTAGNTGTANGSSGSTGTTSGTPGNTGTANGTGASGSTGTTPAPTAPTTPETGGSTASPSPDTSQSAPCPENGCLSPDLTLPCSEDTQWTIQKGQSVSDVQIRNLVSRHTLETANPGVDLDTLRVGQTICVPRENVPCTLPETYTLAEGETLEAVAVRFNLPVASLLRSNPCLAPQDFEAGVTVVLPR